MTAPESIAKSYCPFKIDAEDGESLESLNAGPRKDALDTLILEHGAILLRNFVVDSIEAFRHFVGTFSGKEFFDYSGGASPRHRTRASGVYNSTDYAPEIHIPLHNELSYSDDYPERLYFMCVTSADEGGETTIGDGRRILIAMDDTVVDELRQKLVCYIRNLAAEPGSGYSWPEAFESIDRSAVERICKKQGAVFRWLPDGDLQLRQVRPATVRHPNTGEEVWFNQVSGFYFDRAEIDADVRPRLECTFGDGTDIPVDVVGHIRSVLEEQAFAHSWQDHDVVILDNVLALHGRLPYSGEREIVLAMT